MKFGFLNNSVCRKGRLALQDAQSGSGQPAFAQRHQNFAFIDHGAAAGIHEVGARGHLLQSRVVDQMAGRLGEREMWRVTISDDLSSSTILAARPTARRKVPDRGRDRGRRARDRKVSRVRRLACPRRQGRRCRGFSFERLAALDILAPISFARALDMLERVAQQRAHQKQRQFGGRIRVCFGRVAGDDAAFDTRFPIDVIKAAGRSRNELQARGFVQEFGIDAGLTANQNASASLNWSIALSREARRRASDSVE